MQNEGGVGENQPLIPNLGGGVLSEDRVGERGDDGAFSVMMGVLTDLLGTLDTLCD